MKKSSIFILIILALTFFLINTNKVSSMCAAPDGWVPETDCQNICYGPKVGENCNPRWNCPESCRCRTQICSQSCGAECGYNWDCPGGQCDSGSCQCCAGWNQDESSNGGYPCCPGVVGWMGKCCYWGQDVGPPWGGSCHDECPGGTVWNEGRGQCVPNCECGGGWQRAPGTGGCGNCGLVERRCDGCYWTGDYRCAGSGPCSPGQVWTGGSCGAGGCGTLKNTCQSNCQWQSQDYCEGGDTPYGKSCGICGRGRYDCRGNCNNPPDYSNCGDPRRPTWYSTGSGCGKCGTSYRYCNGCDWTNSYQCIGEGPCSPGQINWGGGCGNCGTLRQDCGSSCQWGGQYCYGEKTLGPCGSCGRGRTNCAGGCDGDYSNCGSAGWKNAGTCGNCGTLQSYCNGCDYTGQTQCVNQGSCSPGQTRGCGNCGTESCGGNCQWSGSCTGQGCSPGQTRGCGNCGTESCGGNCQWSGSCTGQGCSPGTTQPCGYGGTQTCTASCGWGSCIGEGCGPPGITRGCGNCGTQTCQSNYQWGSCTGEGCSPGQTRGCGNCGTESCGGNCQWSGSCANQGLCYPGQTQSQGCGNGGTQSRTCTSSCGWGSWGSCTGEGSCAPGQTQSQGCGNCGSQSRTCLSNYQWGSWGSCAGEGCSPGQTQTQGCGNGGTQSRTCTSSCGWGSWGACAGEGCTSGQTQSCGDCGTQTCQSNNQWSSCTGNGQTQTQACGNCGSQSKTCQSNGVYSAWSACAGQGACPSGQSEIQSCGNCGTQTRTCSSSCQWSSYGTCTGSGPCSPGQTDSSGCTACKTRTCQNNCNWGPCSSSGSCTTGQTQCVNNRYQTCPICSWAGTGTNADSDSRDKECGDSLCDSSPGVYDATKVASETLATCKDTLDNDCDGTTDCADSDCNGVAGCCTVIKRDCKQLTEQQFREMYSRCYKEGDSTYCSKITNQILGGINFYSCEKNDADTSCCQNPSSCVFNGVCYPDGTKVDINGDGMMDRCVAHSPGQWIPDFETDCANGIDDDLDGFIDCADTDCNGNLNGKTINQNGQLISFVDITAKKDLVPVKSVQTAQDGTYTMNIGCGDYNVMSAHSIYSPQTKVVFVPPRGDLSVNFTLVKGTSCEFDCTYASDNLVHASCDGKSGCGFYDSTAKAACDLSQPGWIREYNSSNYVVCPSGSPQLKVEILASLSCTSGTIIKVTKIVVYNGKPVKLVVAACK